MSIEITIDTCTVENIAMTADTAIVGYVLSASAGDYAQRAQPVILVKIDLTEEEQATYEAFWDLCYAKALAESGL